jgi:hypothetical protein
LDGTGDENMNIEKKENRYEDGGSDSGEAE